MHIWERHWMSDVSLQIERLSAGYVADLPILREVSLSVEKGKLTVIIGPNGAGKSTLIKSVAGLLPFTSGCIEYNGSRIEEMPPDSMAGLGISYVPQNDNVFRTLSVEQNLELALRNHHDPANRLSSLMDRFPVLKAKRKAKAGALSGGQRQFLAVAMALALESDLILMDEPSAGLAPKATEEVLDHVRTLAEDGLTVLLVEQNVKQALKRADYCFVLADGRNQIDGPALDLLADPALGRIYLGGERLGAA